MNTIKEINTVSYLLEILNNHSKVKALKMIEECKIYTECRKDIA